MAGKVGGVKRPYKRVLLKLSGEVFQNKERGECLDAGVLDAAAGQIGKAHRRGLELGIVVGGGNIFRGLPGQTSGIGRNTGDAMGMLATVINSLALQAALERHGLPARVMTAVPMPALAEPFVQRRAVRHLEQGRIVIFGAGTGNPFFTTDSAAALRAAEIGADAVLKGTKVDGVYTADPLKDPRARRYVRLTFTEALTRRLKIMDAAAFSLCMDNHIPIVVFNFFKRDEILRVLAGQPVGTLVSGE